MKLVGSRRGAALLIALTLACGRADATPPTLKNAWMRPALAGTAQARAYVDIVSDTALELRGASTPVAQGVEIVVVPLDRDPAPETVVGTLPVPRDATTRLAYRGSHLRLLDIRHDLGNGEFVPITLRFRDPEGKELTVDARIQVRGLLSPARTAAAQKAGAEATATPGVPPPAGMSAPGTSPGPRM